MPSAPWKAVMGIGVIFAALGIVFWWSAGRGPSEARAQWSADSACHLAEDALAYDISTVVNVPPGYEWGHKWERPFNWRITTRVSGQDFHLKHEFLGHDVETEVIYIDGTAYGREKQDGEWSEWATIEWVNVGLDNFPSVSPLIPAQIRHNAICPILSGAGAGGASGASAPGGMTTTRVENGTTGDAGGLSQYRVRYTTDISTHYHSVGWVGGSPVESDALPQNGSGASDASGAIGLSEADTIVHDTWNLWINEKGELTKSENLTDGPPDEAQGSTTRQALKRSSTISGIGDPNVITAPDMAGS